MADIVVIDRRFCGPPTSANGGYTAGLLGSRLSGPVEVTLKRPPPLAKVMQLEGARELFLLDEGDVVAEAKPTTLDLDVPDPPSFAEAEAMSEHYVEHHEHPFPGCFVCGPERAVGDGLRIFPGRTQPEGLVAAPWLPHPKLADGSGRMAPEVIWAALDCPGYFGAAPDSLPTALLGRITGHVEGTVRAGERCVVIGWRLGSDGRKLYAGTALFGEDGLLRGKARQTWITI